MSEITLEQATAHLRRRCDEDQCNILAADQRCARIVLDALEASQRRAETLQSEVEREAAEIVRWRVERDDLLAAIKRVTEHRDTMRTAFQTELDNHKANFSELRVSQRRAEEAERLLRRLNIGAARMAQYHHDTCDMMLSREYACNCGKEQIDVIRQEIRESNFASILCLTEPSGGSLTGKRD